MAESQNTTKLLDLLSQVTEGEVDAEIDALQARLRMLRAIKTALSGNGGAPTSPPPQQPVTTSATTSTTAQEAEPASRPSPSDKKPLILNLMREQPARAWAARVIHSELIERGEIDPKTTIESLRVTLRRMVLKGQLSKVGVDYKLAATEQGGLM